MSGWVRSSFCGGNGECIEARARSGDELDWEGGSVEMRHCARGASWGSWTVTRAEWDAFLAGVKQGDFDDLTSD